MSLEQQIKGKALALGFDAVGITDASPLGHEHLAHFEAWLRAGYAGRMDYMHRNLDKRTHPDKLLGGAKSVIVVALGYRTPQSVIRNSPAEPVGRVAQYAQYEDYHPFIQSLLGELAAFIRAQTDAAQRFKICVDTAPLAEKALAVRAGLGFIGKNHLLIHPRLGPQILLGEIVTTVDLRPDEPSGGSCAGCDRCLKACPAGALCPDGLLDATRCISYLTQYEPAEEGNGGTNAAHFSTIPSFQRPHPARCWLFGCDECLLACPFAQGAPVRANQRFPWYRERAELNLREVLALTAEEFEARFHDSPLRRLGREGLVHNARRCLASQISNPKV